MTQPENQAEALPCPHCGAELIHIRSMARSFDPPREYHEWHHVDDMECWLRKKVGPIVFATTEDPIAQVQALAAWNRRASLPEAPAVPVVKALEWKDIRGDGSLVAFPDIGLAYIASGKAWGHRNYPDQHPVDGGIEAAKAGAQADFEARIRSTLQSFPPVKTPAVDGERAPEGYVLVPIKPTVAMLKAAAEECVRIRHDHEDVAIGGDYWRVMVRAALASQHAVEGEAVAWRDDAFEKAAHIVERWFGEDATGCASDIRALISASPRPAAADAGVREALKDIVEFCDDPEGSEKPESLGMGLARLLPAARAALQDRSNG